MANIPQLEHVLPGPALLSVNEMCEMAPGIPWSNQILDDLLDTLSVNNPFVPEIKLSPPINGITRIQAGIFRERTKKVKGVWQCRIMATVLYYSTDIPNEHPAEMGQKHFPMDRMGMKAAFEFLRTTVQNIKRRGLCEPCHARERPMKRLRVDGTGLCFTCLLKKAALE